MQKLQLGRSVRPFQLPYIGETRAERAAHMARAEDWLTERGLMRNGEVRKDVEDAIVTWSWPDVLLTYDALDFERQSWHLARGGWAGRHGVVSMSDGTEVAFELMRPDEVLGEFRMPVGKAFYGKRAVTIVDDPNADGDGVDGFAAMRDGYQPGGVRRQDGNVRVFFQYGFTGMGIITVGTVRRRGEPAQRLETFTWYDTPNGRFAVMTSTVGDGTLRRVFEPTDGNSLLRWWIADRTD